MKRTVIAALLFVCSFAACALAGQPVKLYLFAGQSNFDYRTKPSEVQKALPDAAAWMESPDNDALYAGWSGVPGKEDKTEVWSRFTWLPTKHGPKACIEHVIGYRLWKYGKEKDPEQRVAFLHVSKGATGLYNYWNPETKGPMFEALDQRLDEAKTAIEKAGLTYEVAGLFWWQGESDTWDMKAPGQYEELFNALLTHVKTKLNVTNVPLVVVRINKALQLPPSNRPRPEGFVEGYPERLEKVRRALVNVAEQNRGVWVDIDDQKQKDEAHYESATYIAIYQRLGDAWFSLMEDKSK